MPRGRKSERILKGIEDATLCLINEGKTDTSIAEIFKNVPISKAQIGKIRKKMKLKVDKNLRK